MGEHFYLKVTIWGRKLFRSNFRGLPDFEYLFYVILDCSSYKIDLSYALPVFAYILLLLNHVYS